MIRHKYSFNLCNMGNYSNSLLSIDEKLYKYTFICLYIYRLGGVYLYELNANQVF